MSTHSFIAFTHIRLGTVSGVSAILTSHIFAGRNKTISKWKKDNGHYRLTWVDKNKQHQVSQPISYLIISEFIRAMGYFSTEHFNLPNIECFWLDFSVDLSSNIHQFGKGAPNGMVIQDSTSQQQYGKNYPITPRLSREGQSFTTLQPQLLDRVMNLRKKLVEDSNLALNVNWFFDLRSLLSDSISLIDITLNQLYIKAEYDPLSGWKFEKDKLGERNARRFNDKLGWVQKISGKGINGEAYLPNVNKLREIRNHLMHFDPPSLIVTIEEATIWLNQILDVGFLLIKIRQAIGVEVSTSLINFVLQKEVSFNPLSHSTERAPIKIGYSDYTSSVW